MSLPTVTTPKYDLVIPELGNKKIKYRPFFVKEHKLLLQAIEFKDESGLLNAIVGIVNACTFEKLDIEKLPVHILDYIFLAIYTKSAGAHVPATYTCRNLIEEEGKEPHTCDSRFNILIPLERAKIVYPDGYQDKQNIEVAEGVVIRLRVPSFENFKSVNLSANFIDITNQFIFACVESISTKEKTQIPGIDFKEDELVAWLDGMDGSVMGKMEAFFQELPHLGLTLPVTCPKCGKKEELELSGLEDFFV